jgi:type II secretory pathway component GspD/PulD (secretin)
VFNNGVLNLQTVEKVTTTQSQTNGTNNNTTNTDKNGNSTNTNGNDQTNGNSWNKTFGPIGDPIVQAFNLSLNPRSFLGSINGFLDALVTNKRSRLLASPKVSVIDGEKTEIFIGDLVKYIESQSQTPQGTTFQIGTVNAGIQLAAVPRVSSDGWITLAIHPEVSLISAFNDVPGGGKLPQISTRYMDTTVRLRDGATLVIGGLIREEDIETITHTPILADLPVLGQFFRHRSKSKVSSEVVIFITVRIAE